MKLPNQILISDIFKHRVRCNKGIDHGPGIISWMHPPVHRVLGWASRPSTLKLSRNIWRLDQIKGIGTQYIYVLGDPSETDQVTIDRLPTLLDSDLLNTKGDRLGVLADIVFNPNTGEINHYLISRSDPRIPGTSRWRLYIDRILDQQPGFVSVAIESLDELPLAKSSIRQDFLKKTRTFRDQIQEFSDKATDKLEGWLEVAPWDEDYDRYSSGSNLSTSDSLDNWDENEESDFHFKTSKDLRRFSRNSNIIEEDEDPWF